MLAMTILRAAERSIIGYKLRRVLAREHQRHLASETVRFPVSNALAGTSFATTTDAPITDPAAILTPGRIVQRAPSHAPLPISMPAAPNVTPRCARLDVSR